MTILPLTYLGNTIYFGELLRGDCIIDLHEHYIKQTYRNRCDILLANGVSHLTIPVEKGRSSIKKPVKDMRIDHSERWLHQHWISIVSGYKNSPYFDHYEHLFAPLYHKKIGFLADFNIGMLEAALKVFGEMRMPELSASYIDPSPEHTDLRGSFRASTQSQLSIQRNFQPYEQVFSDRFPFRPNLSVIDLIFCEGPYGLSALT